MFPVVHNPKVSVADNIINKCQHLPFPRGFLVFMILAVRLKQAFYEYYESFWKPSTFSQFWKKDITKMIEKIDYFGINANIYHVEYITK